MLLKKYFNRAVDFANKSQRAKWIGDLVDQLSSIVDAINHKVAGQIWYHNDVTPYTLSVTQNVHTELKCFEKTVLNTGETLLNVTHNDSYLQANEDGHYRLCWDLNMSGAANHKYHIHLHKNDYMMENIERHLKMSNANDIMYVSGTACSDLVKGDQVSIYIHDETGNSTITVLASMLGIEKLA